MGFIKIISAFSDALCAQRETNVSHFNVMLSAFNFSFGDGDICIKKQKHEYLFECKPSVLWNSMKTLVNFVRHLTSINVLCLAYLKHDNCSQQYSVRHVFIPINWYRRQGMFQNLNYIMWNCLHIRIYTCIPYELVCVLLIFIYYTFELKSFIHYNLYKFPTETFGGMFFYIYILRILVDVRLLDLHVGAGFGEIIMPSV